MTERRFVITYFKLNESECKRDSRSSSHAWDRVFVPSFSRKSSIGSAAAAAVVIAFFSFLFLRTAGIPLAGIIVIDAMIAACPFLYVFINYKRMIYHDESSEQLEVIPRDNRQYALAVNGKWIDTNICSKTAYDLHEPLKTAVVCSVTIQAGRPVVKRVDGVRISARRKRDLSKMFITLAKIAGWIMGICIIGTVIAQYKKVFAGAFSSIDYNAIITGLKMTAVICPLYAVIYLIRHRG